MADAQLGHLRDEILRAGTTPARRTNCTLFHNDR